MRSSWDQYFLEIAETVATRSTCDRLHVGAVLVRDRTIISTGYNGSIRGAPHCCDVGCTVEHQHCITTVHAEANAVAQAARNGSRTDAATCYCTASPCWPCFKLLVNAGITRIVYRTFYRDDRVLQAASDLGIELTTP